MSAHQDGPPEKRCRPATNGTGIHTTSAIDDIKSTAHRRQDGYAAPSAEDRADQAVLDAAAARGYRLAVQCSRCGQWVVAYRSVAAHMVPVCRVRVEGGK